MLHSYLDEDSTDVKVFQSPQNPLHQCKKIIEGAVIKSNDLQADVPGCPLETLSPAAHIQRTREGQTEIF